MVSVSASVNLPLHRKVQKFSSGTGSPGWSRKKGRKTVVVWWWWRDTTEIREDTTLNVTSKRSEQLHIERETIMHNYTKSYNACIMRDLHVRSYLY